MRIDELSSMKSIIKNVNHKMEDFAIKDTIYKDYLSQHILLKTTVYLELYDNITSSSIIQYEIIKRMNI